MALVYLDRAQETSTTQGSGAYDLDGAVLGYQAFTDVGNGNTCYYAATDGREWEVGLGTYILASSRLIRTTILDGSNGTSPVNWRAGTKYVWIDYPANAIAASVTDVTVATANGFSGSSSGGATPKLTLETTVTAAALAGDGTAITAATTTGTGSTVVLAGDPTLTLGNATGLPLTTGVTGLLPTANGGEANVADRTALSNIDTAKNTVAYLEESGRQGWFQWNSANLSTQVSADTLQGIYVAPTSDPTGASGAWARSVDLQGVVTPFWWGAVGDGTSDDQAAVQAAIDSGFHVLLSEGFNFRIESGLTISTNFQRVGGPGRLYPVGNFDAVTVTAIGCELDIEARGALQTGGNMINVNGGSRTRIRRLHIPDGGYNALNVQGANHTVLDWLYTPSLRGAHCIRWYGDNSLRSDILILRTGTCSFSTSGTARGIDWDGNCNSMTVVNFGIVGAPGGGGARPLHAVHIRNTSGGSAPAIGRFSDLEIDYPEDDGVRIDAGLDFDFIAPYVNGSVSGSGFYVAAGLGADQVRIQGGKSNGNNQYGVENGSRVLAVNLQTSSNGVGTYSGTVQASSPRFSLDANAYYTLSGSNPLLVFDANDYFSYDRASNSLIVFIGGVAVAVVTDGGVRQPLNAPITKTGNFTVATTESYLINNKAGSTCTVTLPAASSFPGRPLNFKNSQAQTVVSASSNVVPRVTAAAGTAILASGSGNWCTMVSDGSNWVITAGS